MRLPVLLIAGAMLAAELIGQDGSRGFEKRSSERLLAQARTASDRFAAQLNLGDLSFADGRPSEARRWWQRARETASSERTRLYREGQMSAWARLTAWEAVAAGLLGEHEAMRRMFGLALELLPGDPEIWSRYASAELSAGEARQAVRIARIALAHAAGADSDRHLLDRATIEFTLARALRSAGAEDEARRTLESLDALLHGASSISLQNRVARAEAFSVSGTARGELEAWTTLAVRTRTLLAESYERAGEVAAARTAAQRALEIQSDHPPALALIARLRGSSTDWREAFASDPLDRSLHRSYMQALSDGLPPIDPQGNSTADLVIGALEAMEREEWSVARRAIDQLGSSQTTSEPLRALEAEWLVRQGRMEEAEAVASSIRTRAVRDSIPPRRLRDDNTHLIRADGSLLSEGDLTAIERLLRDPATTISASAVLDSRSYEVTATLMEPVLLDGNTTAAAAITSEGRALRFPAPVTFQGDWTAAAPLILALRVLAVDPAGLMIEAEGVRHP